MICVADDSVAGNFVDGKPERDPRKHVVSIVYHEIFFYHVSVNPEDGLATLGYKAGDDATACFTQMVWSRKGPILKLKNEYQMAFDLKNILLKFIAKKKDELFYEIWKVFKNEKTINFEGIFLKA